MASLKRKKRKPEKVEAYKPPMYPSFTIYKRDGINLDIDEEGIGETLSAKVKLTGFKQQTNSDGTKDSDWSFDIISIDI